MDADAVLMRLSSSLITLLGVAAHLLVAVLSRQSSKQDHSAYILILKIYSWATVVRFLSGWCVLSRAQAGGDGNSIFIAYGPAMLLGPFACGLFQCIVAHLGPFTVLLIPICMGLRLMLLLSRRVTYKLVLVFCGALYLPCALLLVPMVSIVAEASKNVSSPSPNDTGLPFASLSNDIWIQIWYLGSNASYVCVPVTFFLRFIVIRQLKPLLPSFSSRATQLHKSFITLLTFEASVLFIGIFVTILRYLSKTLLFSSQLNSLLSAFSFPILSTMPMIQGIATLVLVPYLRESVLRPFKGCRKMRQVEVSASVVTSTTMRK